MNNTPTPRTDKAEFSFDAFNGVDPWEGERWIKVVPSKISAKLETELTAAREEIKELNDKLDDAVADATNAVNDIIRMKWQRDRLAEALNKYRGQVDNEGNHSAPEALQSLNQNDKGMARGASG